MLFLVQWNDIVESGYYDSSLFLDPNQVYHVLDTDDFIVQDIDGVALFHYLDTLDLAIANINHVSDCGYILNNFIRCLNDLAITRENYTISSKNGFISYQVKECNEHDVSIITVNKKSYAFSLTFQDGYIIVMLNNKAIMKLKSYLNNCDNCEITCPYIINLPKMHRVFIRFFIHIRYGLFPMYAVIDYKGNLGVLQAEGATLEVFDCSGCFVKDEIFNTKYIMLLKGKY